MERATPVEILLVEDNPGDARLVDLLLSEVNGMEFEITYASRLAEAVGILSSSEFDVALVDLSLPDASDLDSVNEVQSVAPYLPVVVLSGMDNEEVALQAIGGGAEDYLVKGQGDGDLIARSIRYAIERRKAEERLAYLAQYDTLTGLANRSLFQDRFAQSVSRADRDDEMMALIMLDLDRFKDFNDALGHDFGDELLKTTASRIQSCVKEGDTVARLGSDEFGIILEDVPDSQRAAQVAQEISESISKPFDLGEHEMIVTASMGISVRPPAEVDGIWSRTPPPRCSEPSVLAQAITSSFHRR